MEKEWDEDQKKRAKNNGHLSDIDSDPDPSQAIEIPEICQICNEGLKNPIKTLCEHFFCEKCALANYSHNSGCFICKRPTNGTFNDGVKAIKKLKDLKESLKKSIVKKKNAKNTEIAEIVEGVDLPVEIDEGEKKKLLEGVEFETEEGEKKKMEGKEEEEELKGMAREFKRKHAKQKSTISHESDWLL